jgi:Holliday junction resolvase RusA-like endonuclease
MTTLPKRPKPAPAFTLRPGESISFVLPVTPRTKKNHGSVIKRGERKFHIPSEPYREMEGKILKWTHAIAGLMIRDGRAHDMSTLNLSQPLNCAAIFHRDANRGDAVGYYQGLADALEAAGVVADDKWITQWDGSRLAKDAERSRIEVTLTAL